MKETMELSEWAYNVLKNFEFDLYIMKFPKKPRSIGYDALDESHIIAHHEVLKVRPHLSIYPEGTIKIKEQGYYLIVIFDEHGSIIHSNQRGHVIHNGRGCTIEVKR